jgi:serine/threonine-protein kinase
MSEHAGTKIQFDTSSYIGREIKGVTFVELVGRGAMGAVFVGFQSSLKRKVAVKIFPKTNSAIPFFKLRFRDEAETVAVLNHPFIAPVFDMGETDDLLYLVMQLIEGENLKDLLKRNQLNPIPSKRLLPAGQVIDLMIKILDALDYAHREGVIHQDIKPGNIIIEERSNRPVLVDFGIAHSAITETDSSPYIMGTPLYMSPEQILSSTPDNRSDIYSAGIVLFEALAGKLPLETNKSDQLLAIKRQDPEMLFTCRPSQCNPAITFDLERIILKAIAPNPQNRYQSCAGFKQDLEKIRSTMR